MDILNICSQLNASEIALLKFLRTEVRKNGLEIIPSASKGMTPYLRVALKKGYGHLNELGLITRTQRGVYTVHKDLFNDGV